MKESPCKDCPVKIDQAILYDEVTCYKTCQKWLDWKRQIEQCGFSSPNKS